ncbi:MAG TPA: class I SAM-dependent methyltransferase [Polyangiaceae bacterium]
MDTTERFSDRVADYVRYRPSYPEGLVAALEARHAWDPAKTVLADVGSGTGISSRLFLERGYAVLGVEPNADMRRAAERDLAAFPRFVSVDGTAEHTTLAAGSVDAVLAAQAFHWFDPVRARQEFARILRPAGVVVLLWNERRVEGAFLEAYEAVLQELSTDYGAVDHRNAQKHVASLFGEGGYQTLSAPNEQRFDRESFLGRALSSSYVPKQGHPKHEAMRAALERVFDAHARDGVVVFAYDAKAYFGPLQHAPRTT